MIDFERYHSSTLEKARTEDLIRMLPKSRTSVLDVGARDGHFSRLLTHHFRSVTALDLTRPAFEHPGVVTVAGDVTALQFPDGSFDCVFCTEVLEHVENLEVACRELIRVARYEIIIGVPFRQDTRVGRTSCRSCGRANPPWGHVNTFDEERLGRLFSGTTVIARSYIGVDRTATNPLSTLLMDVAGNPWGAYNQAEPCIHCGQPLTAPKTRTVAQKVCSGLALRINLVQRHFTKPHANWIHIVFSKDSQ